MTSKQLTQQTKIKNIPGETPEIETDRLHTKKLFFTPSHHTLKLTVLTHRAGSEAAPSFHFSYKQSINFSQKTEPLSKVTKFNLPAASLVSFES